MNAPVPSNTPSEDHAPAHASSLLATVRLLRILFHTVWIYGGYKTLTAFVSEENKYPLAQRWTRRWMVMLCRVCNFQITSSGPEPPEPALLCPNHHGYVDILALNTVVDTFFLSKAEVSGWPVLGRFVRDAHHLLVKREERNQLGAVLDALKERLSVGYRVCVFLEGTSSGGDNLLPFRPALLQAAVDTNTPIVPVAIRWSSSDPAVSVADDVAYWRDHAFGPHAWRLLGLMGTRVSITFGEAISPGASRKVLANQVQHAVFQLGAFPSEHESAVLK